MSAQISLEKLFEEQNKPAELLFVITPLDDEFVRMRLWRPHEKCLCGGFVKVPRSAIRSVTQTGKTAACCGKLFQVVAVEFSAEPALTYRELFDTMLRLAGSGRRRKPRAIRRIILPKIAPVIPPNPGGGGGDDDDDDDDPLFTGDPYTDSQKQQECVRECVAFNVLNYPPKNASPQQFQQWLQQLTNTCIASCAHFLTTGDPNPDSEDEPDEDE